MTDQIAPSIKSARHARLLEIESKLRQEYYRSLIGRQLTVLLEGPSETTPGSMAGTSCRYAPVETPAADSRLSLSPGSLTTVTARNIADYGTKIVGEPTTTRGAGA
jgi:tRNA A37 methylthiotransferase MiaB